MVTKITIPYKEAAYQQIKASLNETLQGFCYGGFDLTGTCRITHVWRESVEHTKRYLVDKSLDRDAWYSITVRLCIFEDLIPTTDDEAATI